MTGPREGGAGRPPDGGPRFALRFEDGRGRLSLARRHRFALGVVERLELDLGALRFPLDLSRGPARFRTRRTRVLAAELRVDLAALIERAVEEPYALEPLAPRSDGLLVALRDPYGVIALEAHARAEGADVVVALGDARAATEGPAPPLSRALVASRALGLAHDAERGAFVFARALSALLTEALVPHGWRVPDDRGARLTIEVLGPRRLRLTTLSSDADAAPRDPAPWEAARRLAPIVAALARGDHDAAQRAWEAHVERGGLDATTRDEAATLGLGGPLDPDRPAALALTLRDALRAGDPDGAARAALALAEVEQSDAVAVEGLCAAADLAIASRPALASALLERAYARRPSDARLALRLGEVLARLGRHDALASLLDGALDASEPGPPRGEIAKAAATVCALAGVAPLAARLWRRAAEHLPHDPAVLEGLASSLESAGALDRALEAWDRAARALTDEAAPEDEARVLASAARVAQLLGRLDVAEERLTRATARAPHDAARWGALSSVRRALGAEGAAARAEDELLSAVQRVPRGAAAGAVLDALRAAATAAIETGRVERARSFASALSRCAPPDDAGWADARVALAARLDALERSSWREHPERVLSLSPPQLARLLADEADPRQVLLDAQAVLGADATARAIGALAARVGDARVGAAIASVAAALADRIEDADGLAVLAEHASDDEARFALASAAARRLEAEGRLAEAALAKARAGRARRDTAMLRAALTTAERLGAIDVALEIVELAFAVVGDGPARRALELVRARLEASTER